MMVYINMIACSIYCMIRGVCNIPVCACFLVLGSKCVLVINLAMMSVLRDERVTINAAAIEKPSHGFRAVPGEWRVWALWTVILWLPQEFGVVIVKGRRLVAMR